MELQKITWKFSRPAEFPCMACGNQRAELMAKFEHNGVRVNLCLCAECANLPETILIEKIFNKSEIKI